MVKTAKSQSAKLDVEFDPAHPEAAMPAVEHAVNDMMSLPFIVGIVATALNTHGAGPEAARLAMGHLMEEMRALVLGQRPWDPAEAVGMFNEIIALNILAHCTGAVPGAES